MSIDRILRMPEIIQRTGRSKSSIYRMRNSGELKFIKIGRNSVGVRESVLSAWIESREVVEVEESANDDSITGDAA